MIHLFLSNLDLLSLKASLCIFNKKFTLWTHLVRSVCVVKSASLPKRDLVRLSGNSFKPLWGACTTLLMGGNQDQLHYISR